MKTKNIHTLFTQLVLVMTLVLTVACQQVPVATDNGNPPTQPGITISGGVELCPDGTLDCYVTFPGTPEEEEEQEEIINDPINAFNSCMSTCFAASPNATCQAYSTQPNFIDLNVDGACAETYQGCLNSCNVLLDAGGVGNMPDSDPLGIPEATKAVLVQIETCMTQRENTFQFKGPSGAVKKFHSGRYNVVGNIFNKRINLPTQTALHESCPAAVKGKAMITFKPHKQGVITIGSQNFETIPFPDDVPDTINMTWKAPHLTSFQLPSEINAHVDYSQISWMLKQIHTPQVPLPFIGMSYISQFFHYNNNQVFTDSIVYFHSFADTHTMKFDMIAFIKSN